MINKEKEKKKKNTNSREPYDWYDAMRANMHYGYLKKEKQGKIREKRSYPFIMEWCGTNGGGTPTRLFDNPCCNTWYDGIDDI